MTLVVDYPWSHPSAAALQAAGVFGVMRYLSTDPTKNLTRAEADDLAAHGIWSGVVWETTATRALDGQAAGANDARAAVAQASACGMPDSRPIYFAVDTDTDWASVEPYFHGVASVLGTERVGVYGGLHVVQGAIASGLVAWYWQTSAWSGHRDPGTGQWVTDWDDRAHLRQGGSITVGGVDCDRNTAMTPDYGQWMPGIDPQEDIVTPQEKQDIINGVIAAVGPAVWNYEVPDWGLDADGNAKALGTSKEAYWHLTWGDVFAAQQAARDQKILAAQAAITALATQLSQTHGVDTATVVKAVQDAIAAATVHVQVAVTGTPAAPAAPAAN